MARRPRARSLFDSVRAGIGTALRLLYSNVLNEQLPDAIVELLQQLDQEISLLHKDGDKS
jgi:Anti-sigma factor NepR